MLRPALNSLPVRLETAFRWNRDTVSLHQERTPVMPNTLMKMCILIAAALLAGSKANAQEEQLAKVTKPLAYRGSFEAEVDDNGNLVITPIIVVPVTEERRGTRNVWRTVKEPREETYTVDVGGQKEIRTRTVEVSRQISEQIPYTYSVAVGKPEVREPLKSPKLYYFTAPENIDLELPVSPLAPVGANIKSSKDAIFVRATSDVLRAAQLFEESIRRQTELTGIDPSRPQYIVVLDEPFDEAALARAREQRISIPSLAATLSRGDAATKAIGQVGTIVMAANSPDRLLLETTYEVTVCQPEERTRTVIVRQPDGSDVTQEDRYTVMVPHKEIKQGRLDSPVIYEVPDSMVPFGKQATDRGLFQENRSVIFVMTTKEAFDVYHMLNDAARLLREAGVTPPKRPDFIVVQGETFNYATASSGREVLDTTSPDSEPARREPEMPAPTETVRTASPIWPLPTDKSAWIGSLPFTQKALNGKAMVLWFFEEGCPRCKAKWRELNSLPLAFRGKPVVFVAVNSGNSPELVADYVKQNKVNLAVIADTDRQLEKLADFGEISLNNIYQVAIMTPDGQLHPADANDLKGTAEAAMKLVK